MILHLHVRDYALIDSLEISFGEGLTTITGETGAGKSILLGAIGLALGQRADLKSLLVEDRKCVVELTVQLKNTHFQPLFKELNLDYEDQTILRREVLPGGKSRAFVNDTPVVLTDLAKISGRLIDIHSQNDTLLLRDPVFQLELIDIMAGNGDQKLAYEAAWGQWNEATARLEELMQEKGSKDDVDYLRFLYDELQAAKLEHPEEEDILEQDLQKWQHLDDVVRGMQSADEELSGSRGILERLHTAIQFVNQAARYDKRLEEWIQRLQSSKIELDDLHREMTGMAMDTNSDPGALERIDERISIIRNLKMKHRVETLPELMAARDRLGEKLMQIEQLDERKSALEKEIHEAREDMEDKARALSASRAAIIPSIEEQVAQILTGLNMPAARVVMKPETTDVYRQSGIDRVDWFFSANSGRNLQALGKVASGGELSRVMLAMKSILSVTRGLPTVIFDEIDTGISGETARRVADILKQMGKSMQVLAITHLPQIAAAGNQNYKVEKTMEDGRVRTGIRILNEDERIDELSRILSGDKPSEIARANARELLESIRE